MPSRFTCLQSSSLATADKFPWAKKMFPFNWLLFLTCERQHPKENKQTKIKIKKKKPQKNPQKTKYQQVKVLNWTGRYIKGNAFRNVDDTLDTVHDLNMRLRWNVRLVCGVAKWWEGCRSVLHWVKDTVRIHFSKKLPSKAHLSSPLHAAQGGWFIKESPAPHAVCAMGVSTTSAFVKKVLLRNSTQIRIQFFGFCTKKILSTVTLNIFFAFFFSTFRNRWI